MHMISTSKLKNTYLTLTQHIKDISKTIRITQDELNNHQKPNKTLLMPTSI